MTFSYLRFFPWRRLGVKLFQGCLCLLILSVIFLVSLSGLSATEKAPPPHVLILNSYHPGYTWSDDEVAGVIQELRRVYPKIDPVIEYLDTKRFPTGEHLLKVKDYLASKYRGHQFDLVITLDNPALELALVHRQKLFPGTPIVFAGVNNFKPAMRAGQKKVTGVAELLNIAETLKTALALHPEIKKVFAVTDYTTTGQAVRKEMEALLPVFQNKVQVKFSPPGSMAETINHLKELPTDTMVLILSYTADQAGKTFAPGEVTHLLTQDISIPVYALHEIRLGHGIIGGILLSGKEEGRRAGEIALRVLAGENPSRIPVDMRSTARPMFDYRQLTQFKIPLSALPVGSIIINRPQSFYSLNKALVWGLVSVVITLSLVVFGLSINTIRRRKAEEALQESEKRFRDVTENARAWIWEIDAEGKYTYVSPIVKKLLGYKPEEVLGKNFIDFFLPQDLKELKKMTFTVFAGKQPIREFINRSLHKDGNIVWLSTSIVPMLDKTGNLLGYRGADIDISERKKAEEELKNTVSFLEDVITSSVDPMATVDEQGRFTRWNLAAAEAYGYSAEGLAGLTTSDLYADKEAMEKMLGQLRRDGFVRGYEIDMQKKDKTIAPFSLSIRLLRDENGKSIGSVCVARDLTETRKTLTALGQANARLQTLVEESNRRSREATLIISMSKSLQSCLKAAEAYTIIAGFAQKLFSGLSGALFILAPSKNIVEVVSAWGYPLATEKVFSPEDCWAIRRRQVYLSGQEIHCHHLPNLSAGFYVCLPLVAQGQAFGLMHLQGSDEVTPLVGDQLLLLAKTVADHISLALANIQLRDILRFDVIHDALTGLFNRRYLDETLNREISRVQRKKASLGFIMMDLDHFKRFNDTYSHEAGDQLLQALGNYLQTHVRQEDIVCRYGGEEFVLIMPEASLDVVKARAEEIRENVAKLQMTHRGQLLESTTVSLGVAIFPDHGATGEDALRAADDAMYQAKREGRNRVVVAEGHS